MPTPIRTRVAIVGAGPAGLLLSHLLHLDGIESIVIDNRTRADIEKTIRAGILENGTVDLLVETGASDRVLKEAHRHEGIELQFQGEGHRIDFQKLVGRAVYLYPQHEVLIDLLARRIADGGDIRFEHEAIDVDGTTEAPRVVGKDAAGQPFEIVADVVIGADGSRSVARTAVVGSMTGGYFREYPFAWFGILCEAPPSSDELIYANSDNGFALISQRSATVQRMYLQCDPEQDPNEWSDAQIWDSLQTRVAGRTLHEGPIFQRDVLRFRSFVAHKLQKGRVFLAGDAAHTVPPTGAKGLNLAVNDVRILHEGLLALFTRNDTTELDRYEERALHRIWRAQHFSWWMTSMLHSTPDASDFDRRRQIGELESVVSSDAAMTYLAEAYTGWPYD
ncbi:MAG: 4-hydroxybenzoate 3-monooxygenase [Pseudolysinimonas sp.]|uniref:4-hydroxybenzoate 3-monooxygenase n=1 Tax=Pseudolysinimonas sp. TaxID=2680009 RepID=UPI003C768768